jgi:hypothetical protein
VNIRPRRYHDGEKGAPEIKRDRKRNVRLMGTHVLAHHAENQEFPNFITGGVAMSCKSDPSGGMFSGNDRKRNTCRVYSVVFHVHHDAHQSISNF